MLRRAACFAVLVGAAACSDPEPAPEAPEIPAAPVPAEAAPEDPRALTFEHAHDSIAERATETQLRRLLAEHDVERWIETRHVIIDEEAIPHSHPVLTLHARHLEQDDALLSTFVHEQTHRWLDDRDDALARAVDALRARYPEVPVGFPEGAQSDRSTYEHLVVCWLEIDAMRRVLGAERAGALLAFWAGDHYRWVYRTLQSEADWDAVGAIVRANGLRID